MIPAILVLASLSIASAGKRHKSAIPVLVDSCEILRDAFVHVGGIPVTGHWLSIGVCVHSIDKPSLQLRALRVCCITVAAEFFTAAGAFMGGFTLFFTIRRCLSSVGVFPHTPVHIVAEFVHISALFSVNAECVAPVVITSDAFYGRCVKPVVAWSINDFASVV